MRGSMAAADAPGASENHLCDDADDAELAVIPALVCKNLRIGACAGRRLEVESCCSSPVMVWPRLANCDIAATHKSRKFATH
jgi:hypothetical protein